MAGIEQFLATGISMIMQYVPKVVLALVVLIIGMWIIKKVVKGIVRGLQVRKIDE